MYRSLYEFQTKAEGALSFSAGDDFIGIDTIADPHWSLVVNNRGHVGYAPANYLAPLESVSKRFRPTIILKLFCLLYSKSGAWKRDANIKSSEACGTINLAEVKLKRSLRSQTVNVSKLLTIQYTQTGLLKNLGPHQCKSMLSLLNINA